MESLGICLGASTISLVGLRKDGEEVKTTFVSRKEHNGNPRQTLRDLLGEIKEPGKFRIAATGRKFKDYLALSTISEPEAIELACARILPPGHPYRVVVSAGGETTMVYTLDGGGKVRDIHTGNKCASGTGEFFLQQLGRMSITLDEVPGMEMPDEAYRISGRCSVFCKSDCTHALNKGVPKPQVVAGLARMMAGKVMELLKKAGPGPVMLTGGCSKNRPLVHYLKRELDDLFIPAEATWFEALGAAVWALENDTIAYPGEDAVFVDRGAQFSFLEPLTAYEHMVEFKHRERGTAEPGNRTILGLDVGSTTTKGVIMRRSDKAILAADYLRTNGDPVNASRRVYESLASQLDVPVRIEGVGVTGSGRQIAGLHAMSDGVINEIIAHATGAVHFDADVDTIFEIGGQDAKYTYITNGVPSDYAMNEACSAGTGSFLEEAAWESLGVRTTEIGERALKSTRPPNFNDQCAAFIGSDIKGAAQENIPLEDILAGQVYSICMNYDNRVKGNRPVGNKVFMQGGVCYNRAVPVAMAALTGKRIVVPPEPGLMGALGVALEVERRMGQGRLAPGDFDLKELAEREVTYDTPFICPGNKECDRGCEIARIRIGGKVYPFGGICNRYDNLVRKRKVDAEGLNLAQWRERRVFRDLAPDSPEDGRPTVGMNRSFLVNTYFPLFNAFFEHLGYRLVLPDEPDPLGVDRQGAPFCFPVELAHGFAQRLVDRQPDFFFLPHLRNIPIGEGDSGCTCVFVQGEPFYLRAAFSEIEGGRVISPTLELSGCFEENREAFVQTARKLGVSPKQADSAFQAAMEAQNAFRRDLRAKGREALERIQDAPSGFGVVLFGRPYNSFASVANKGIPDKLASRGVPVIPLDMLPFDDEPLGDEQNMYWAMGRMILKGAQFVEKRPDLFGTYITNFSCGPDSFVISFFRDTMGRKPSLTLELDSHTADAGLDTRIEAFLDIVQFYRQISAHSGLDNASRRFAPAAVEFAGREYGVRNSSGRWLPLDHADVKVLFPSMGKFGTPLLAATMRKAGVDAEVVPPADEEALKIGRGNSSCKECLPLQTTVGSLLHYLEHRPEGKTLVYIMGSAEGPCRFGQYNVFFRRIIEQQRIPDVAVWSPTAGNGYGGQGSGFSSSLTLAAWRAIVIGDIFDEIWATLLAGAKDREQALGTLDAEYRKVSEVIHKGWFAIAKQLSESARTLSGIELKQPYEDIPKVSLIGEIYVRHDPISLQGLIERMAERGFAVRTAPNSEWLKYVDWLIKTGIEGEKTSGFWTRYQVKKFFDQKIRKLLAPSGLFFYEEKAAVEPFIDAARKFISPNLTGEAVLTVGAALHEILHPACGIISIGPFGCMPSRLAEAILSKKFTAGEKAALSNGNGHAPRWLGSLAADHKLPFIAIETDGNVFPQSINARLEAFCLQARRLSDMMAQRM